MRNLDKKRAYDRKRYATLREENPEGVREAERIRKAMQRGRKREIETRIGHGAVSLDDPKGQGVADQQQYKDWSDQQFRD